MQEQLDEIGVTAEAIFGAKFKNTAPTVLCSILNLDDKDYSGNVLIMPTDHSVIDEKEFSKCIEVALKKTSTMGKSLLLE